MTSYMIKHSKLMPKSQKKIKKISTGLPDMAISENGIR